jgi:DNA-binding NarL/FixJ family response regulator
MEITMDTSTIKLSKRENEVCNLLLTGNCTNKIAELLNIKCNTVSTIKKSIFYKTKTNNLIELYEVYKQV